MTSDPSAGVDLDPGRPGSGPRRPLSGEALRRTVVTPDGPWTALEVVAQTGSTNADLVAAAEAGAPAGLVRVAEHQHAGRGRSGRDWVSPPRAGLTFSVLLRPADEPHPVPLARWGLVTLVAGVALVAAVRRTTGLVATLKWPNDLLVGGYKCAGVLAELAGNGLVLGIGLNVDQRAGELPEPVAGGPPPGSLALAGAADVDRDELLVVLLDELADGYARWRAAGGDSVAAGLLEAYLTASATVGRRVRVLLPGGGRLVGEAVTVDATGRLVVRDDEGAQTAVAAGDVAHVRAA